MSWKAKRLEEKGDIIRLKRGLYVVSPEISGIRINEFLLANHIYGPSYVSMQTALRYYGLIPENVYKTSSITLRLAKTYYNRFGTFDYIHSSAAYYPVSIINKTEGNVSFLIASPEKALCDLIIFTPNLSLRYSDEIRAWLEEDLRFDMDSLYRFNTDIMRSCASLGKKKQIINNIIKLIEHERAI